MQKNLLGLVQSSKFWFTVYAVGQIVVLQFFPQVTPDMWKAVDTLIALIIGSFTVGVKIGTARAAKLFAPK